MNPGTPIIGLVGGIAAGKSTAAAMLEDMGAEVIDADTLVHTELEKDEVIRILSRWWPETVVNGKVNRSLLAKTVFRNRRLVGRLEGLLWPRVHTSIESQIRAVRSKASVRAVVIDAPMLLEAGLEVLCDYVIFIEADPATRLERVRSRGWSEKELARREATQMSVDEKRRRATHVLTSDGELKRNLSTLVESLLESG